jgi:hypothetical protein
LAHASYSESARAKARAITQHPFQIPEVADCCAAPWLVFPPPLTDDGITPNRSDQGNFDRTLPAPGRRVNPGEKVVSGIGRMF